MKHIMFAGLVSCATFFTLGLGAADDLLVPNGDFEEGMYDWDSPTWPKNSLISTTIEGESVGKGKRCLLIAPPVGKNTTVFSTVPIKFPAGAKKLSLTMMIKVAPGAAAPESNGKMEIRQYYKSSAKSYGSAAIQFPFSDFKTEWTQFKLESNVPQGAETTSIWIMYGSNKEPVKIYIDDVQINVAE